ncbi:host attachment protein [Falsiroseomonas tokyonensis]|uniref:Host attachment protein n=1 Tax=Falsiroseomonas tokyonensis TaxID=430521 RepID=A0ABV7C2V4_9PROT|nr:host attachment protein [Falsiroseomonas tokyonensis]
MRADRVLKAIESWCETGWHGVRVIRWPCTEESDRGPLPIEPRTDPHQEAKRAFAGQLAEGLAKAATEGSSGRLILVAPASFPGELRAALLDRARGGEP